MTGTEGPDAIQFWDSMTGRPKKTYSGRLYDMSVFAERPGGAVMAAGSVMGITLWEGANGAADRLETGDYGSPAALAWSPDGRALAVGQAGIQWLSLRLGLGGQAETMHPGSAPPQGRGPTA